MKCVYCPLCDSEVELDQEWARKNERLFCGTCCKSFEFKLPRIPTCDYAYTPDENLIDEDDYMHYNNLDDTEPEEDQ